jgi:hypothetical protein
MKGSRPRVFRGKALALEGLLFGAAMFRSRRRVKSRRVMVTLPDFIKRIKGLRSRPKDHEEEDVPKGEPSEDGAKTRLTKAPKSLTAEGPQRRR